MSFLFLLIIRIIIPQIEVLCGVAPTMDRVEGALSGSGHGVRQEEARAAGDSTGAQAEAVGSAEEVAASEAAGQAAVGKRPEMKPHDFIQKLDETKVVRAIQAAERKTSGEIRVFVTNRNLGSDKAVETRRRPI